MNGWNVGLGVGIGVLLVAAIALISIQRQWGSRYRRELQRADERLREREAELERLRREQAQPPQRGLSEGAPTALSPGDTGLEDKAEWSREEARQVLLEQVRADCNDELIRFRNEFLNQSEREIEAEAKRILMTAMQRLATTPQYDITATIVSLPSDDLKGRIIGREGRNIKAFESATGTTLLIDETPDSVLVSSFDPVRREVARVALEHLIRDGRIHPTAIEEAVEEAREQVNRSVVEFGERAMRQLRLSRLHPEIISLLGRMRFRLSNNQNSLDHSIEVGHLCALLAAELGLDVDLAKRCGLLHDIGKVLSEEYEGSHATAGANFLKRYGEDEPRLVNAVAAHHGEVHAESVYVPLLMMADSISAMRPGARSESVDSYIQRVRNLEDLARSFKGVSEAYAIQAGREIRVIVSPETLQDGDVQDLARQIRRRIEEELQYPGTIKVTVIRELRVHETAR